MVYECSDCYTEEEKHDLESSPLKVADIDTSFVAVPLLLFQIICGGEYC
jgi:hypothetical protein